MTSVAIMQPTFIPWIGYFAMIGSVDKFVILDDVQFSKQSWQSRNQIKTSSGPLILSLGVSRAKSKPLIKDANLATTGFEKKLLKSIYDCLGRAPFYSIVADLLEGAFDAANGSLCDLNAGIIKKISSMSGFDTEFFFSSELGIVSDAKGDRLVDICQHLEAHKYLSPVGSLDYLLCENPFAGSKVDLVFLNYRHPEYEQFYPPFMSQMSVIDALAHLGPHRLKSFVMSGCETPLTIDEVGVI